MSRALYNINVVCRSRSCPNDGVSVRLGRWFGNEVTCGPCGRVIKGQTVWYTPPELEAVDPVDTAAQALAALTAEERAALIALLTPPQEGE